jgi:hypothetical protein
MERDCSCWKKKKKKKRVMNFNKIIVGTFVHILYALPHLAGNGDKNEPYKFPLNSEHTFFFFLHFFSHKEEIN